MDEIIGREQELGTVEAFVARRDDRPASLLLQGEAGSGKTTLWLAGCEAARSAGARVLVARPLQAETGFAFAGIADLLKETTELIAELPDPQERALRVALLLESAGEIARRRASGRARAPRRPAAARARRAGHRRCGRHSVARRAFGSSAHVRCTPARRDGCRLPPGAPARGAVAARDRPGARVARAHADSGLATRSRGRASPDPVSPRPDPLAADAPGDPRDVRGQPTVRARARPRAPGRLDGRRSGARLVVPKSLRDLVGARIAELPDETREVLLFSAALADPALEIVSAAAGADASRTLEPAVAGEVVELADGRVRFTHPLLAAAAYEGSGRRTKTRGPRNPGTARRGARGACASPRPGRRGAGCGRRRPVGRGGPLRTREGRARGCRRAGRARGSADATGRRRGSSAATARRCSLDLRGRRLAPRPAHARADRRERRARGRAVTGARPAGRRALVRRRHQRCPGSLSRRRRGGGDATRRDCGRTRVSPQRRSGFATSSPRASSMQRRRLCSPGRSDEVICSARRSPRGQSARRFSGGRLRARTPRRRSHCRVRASSNGS